MNYFGEKSNVIKIEFLAVVILGLTSAIGYRIFPHWPWLFIGAGVLAFLVSATRSDIFADSLLIEQSILGKAGLLCGVAALGYIGTLFLITIAVTVFDLLLFWIGWERSGFSVGHF